MRSTILCLMCLLLIGTTAQAWDVINVDFVYGASTVTSETGQGALGTGSGWVWAYLASAQTQSTPVTVTDVVDFEGNPTTVDVIYDALSRGAYGADSVQSSTLPANNGHEMMSQYITTQGKTNTVRIQGLTAGGYYTLYLFGHGDNENQNTEFTVNGVTKASTIDVAGLTQLTEDAHYVVFDLVAADENGQIQIDYANGPLNEWGSFNGFQITPGEVPGAANTPVPTGDSVDSTVVSSVSWSAPDEPNLVSIEGYDVYWSASSSDFNDVAPVSSMQAGLTFDPTDFGLAAITFETTYYWRVDTHVVWDSNEVTGSLTDVIQSIPWEFTTLPQYLSPELALDNVITTLDLLPASLSATVSGNSDPITGVTFTLLDDDFQFPAGANAALTDTTSDNQNPTATLTTDKAGTYKVKLEVTDGTTPVEATAEIVVYSDACQAKKDSPSGWTADYFDTNDDCIINLLDLEDMADEWLNTTSMDAQETYSGGPGLAYFVADITIDSADVYSTTDLNYVSEAPLEVNSGGPRIATHADALGGSVIGYTDPNDFVTYEIEIPAGQGGDYTVYVANAFPSGDPRSIALGTVSADDDPTNDDITAYGTIELSDGTGWGNAGSYEQFKLDSATISFTEGTHLVRVTWIDGACNLDYIALKKE